MSLLEVLDSKTNRLLLREPFTIMQNQLEGRHVFFRWLVGEPTVLAIIALNVLAVFVGAFPQLPESMKTVCEWIDYACVAYFVIEAVIKIGLLGVGGYWSRVWNRIDFLIVIFCVPLLLRPPTPDSTIGAFAIASLLRMGRFLRFVRVMRFVPDAARLWEGTKRALRASIGVFVVLLVLNLIMAMGANLLFGEKHPEHFGDPLIANYTLFKVFTVEGWYEIPDELADDPTATTWEIAGMRAYFMTAVLVGGILGLSLANAVFVDEMTTDNTDTLERQVAELHAELKEMREEMRKR